MRMATRARQMATRWEEPRTSRLSGNYWNNPC